MGRELSGGWVCYGMIISPFQGFQFFMSMTQGGASLALGWYIQAFQAWKTKKTPKRELGG